MKLSPPSGLRVVVDVVRSYVIGKETKPLVICGPVGCGKKWWVQKVLEEYGYEPFFSFDVKPVGRSLITTGAKRFPVYFSGEVIQNYRAIYLVDDEEEIKDKKIQPISFPEPTKADLTEYLAANNLPIQLADGVSDYAVLINTIRVWKTTQLTPQAASTANKTETWDGWKAGGTAPYSGPLFCWYYSYHEEPSKTWLVNHQSWLKLRIPAKIYRLAEWAQRFSWSGGFVRFPPPLKTKMEPKGKTQAKPVQVRKTVRHSITW